MHSKFIGTLAVLSLGMALTSASAVAQIYKTVDKDGNVVFTDVPPNDEAGTVKLEEYNTYKPVTEEAIPAIPATESSPTSNAADDEADIVETRYNLVNITTPGNDQAIRQNNGMVNVSVNTDPPVNFEAGHRVQVLLDGAVKAEGSSPTLVLENVDRGTHQLSVQVTNASGDVLASSATNTFHLHRYSVLTAPNRPKPKPKPSP